MKKYTYTATRDFTQSYKITIEAKNKSEADNIVYSLKYNSNNEWEKEGDLEADDKLIDIELINDKERRNEFIKRLSKESY